MNIEAKVSNRPWSWLKRRLWTPLPLLARAITSGAFIYFQHMLWTFTIPPFYAAINVADNVYYALSLCALGDSWQTADLKRSKQTEVGCEDLQIFSPRIPANKNTIPHFKRRMNTGNTCIFGARCYFFIILHEIILGRYLNIKRKQKNINNIHKPHDDKKKDFIDAVHFQ